MAYDTKHKEKRQESPLEHEDDGGLCGPVFREFTIHIFQSISFLQTLEIDINEVERRKVDIEFKKNHTRKVILFDLDETLAHCVHHKNLMKEPDVFLNIRTPTGNSIKAGFNIRPYCKQILELANTLFEVCVFTASNPEYADTILDYIDPTGELIQHRYYRESCIKTTDNVYVKDLRIFRNVPLKDIIIVDNAVYSFGNQLDNGIPITPFKEDPEDQEF
jgi:CTD small phosphatase-like protein 2